MDARGAFLVRALVRQPVFRRGMKVPRTTSAGKPDANFLLEIKHGLNDAQQKFHAEWRGQSTIRPPINGKGRAVTPGLL